MRGIRFTRVRTCLLLSLVTWSTCSGGGSGELGTAWGQEPPAAPSEDANEESTIREPPTREQRRQADKLFQLGQKASDVRDYPTALRCYREALRIAPAFYILANLAQLEAFLGEYVSAAEHLSKSLRWDQVPENRAKMEKQLAEISGTRVARVLLHVEPSGAQVELGGSLRGTAPLRGPLFLLPGSLNLVVKKAGYQPWEKHELVKAGDSLTFRVSLQINPASVQRGTADPSPDSAAWKAREARTAVLISEGTVALGALVVAGALALRSHSLKQTVDDLRTQGNLSPSSCTVGGSLLCEEINAKAQSTETVSRWAIGFGVLGAVAASATVATWALWRPNRKENPPRTELAPSVGGGNLGLAWRGRF